MRCSRIMSRPRSTPPTRCRLPSPQMEQVKTEVAPVANDELVEDLPVSNSASEQWHENSSHSGSSSSDPWEQHRYRDRRFGNRGTRLRGASGPPHIGRGRGGQKDHEHRGFNDNQHRFNNLHAYIRHNRIGNQNSNEENRVRPRDGYQRYNNDGYRDQRFGGRNERYEEHQKQTDEQENRSRERENCSRVRLFPQKYDDGTCQKDIKEIPQKVVRPKDGMNRETTDTKNTKETRPQGQETQHGKDNNLNVFKDENKEIPTSLGSQNQNQGSEPINRHIVHNQDHQPPQSNLCQQSGPPTINHCAYCGHKNVTTEAEIIERAKQIDKLKDENDVFRKQIESLKADVAHLQSQRSVVPAEMVNINLGSLLSTLEEVAQCPVCLEMMKTPVTMCVNGHGVCSSCKTSLIKCPTCRKPFCPTEPRILNEILQKLPKLCKFYDKGCRVPATGDHELYCEWRTVRCILPHKYNKSSHCNWEGCANYWTDKHVYDREFPHLDPCWVEIDETETFKIRKFKDLVPTKSIFNNSISPKELREIVFYYRQLKGNFWLYIKHLPLKKPTQTIYFTISFGSNDEEVFYKYKIKVTTMLSLERDVNVEDNIYCVRVPVDELEKLLDKEGALSITCKRTTEPL